MINKSVIGLRILILVGMLFGMLYGFNLLETNIVNAQESSQEPQPTALPPENEELKSDSNAETSADLSLIEKYSTGSVLEVLTVPADGTLVSTSFDLKSNFFYAIRVSGTYVWGGCDPITCPGGGPDYLRYGDADYLTDDHWQSFSDPYWLGFIYLEVNGTDPNFGQYNPDHVYTLLLEGNDEPANFKIHDCSYCYPDNSGYLTVEILFAYSELSAPFSIAEKISWSDPLERNERLSALNGLNGILESQQELDNGKLGYKIFAWGGFLGYFNPFVPKDKSLPSEEAFIQSLMGSEFTAPISGDYRIIAELEMSGNVSAAAGAGFTDILLTFIPGEFGNILDIIGISRITNPANLFPKKSHSDNALILKIDSLESREEEGFGNIAADTVLLPEFEYDLNGVVSIETLVYLEENESVVIKAGLESDIDAWGNAFAFVNTVDAKLIKISIDLIE